MEGLVKGKRAMKMNHLFVYGTLMRGMPRQSALEEATFLGPAIVRGVLYDQGAYPALKEGRKIVVGELYEVSDELFNVLDQIEGYTEGNPQESLYLRKKTPAVILADGESIEASCYYYNHSTKDATEIDSGDYRLYCEMDGEGKQWVAAYGSNIDRSRLEERVGRLGEALVGRLPGFSLVFNKKANNNDSTYANIKWTNAESGCPAVVWQLTPEQISKLDGKEGCPDHYLRVGTLFEAADGTILTVHVYIAHPDKLCIDREPEDSYFQFIRSGYKQNNLDLEYLKAARSKASCLEGRKRTSIPPKPHINSPMQAADSGKTMDLLSSNKPTICEGNTPPMTPLKTLLTRIREISPTERDKGSSFERLIQFYLKNDPKYDFSEVLLWKDWAKANGQDARDTGIDLVAEDRETKTIWAIQCKFYAEDAKIYKRHVDSFFTESGKAPFGHRLIVLTTSKISDHVERAKEQQQIPCSTLSLNDLEDSPIDWAKYAPDTKATFRTKKNLFPHQQKALTCVKEGLATADRGKLLMACGTGKTFTALKIAEELVGAGGKVLFLVPSISLMSQTITEWTAETTTPLYSFAVCSDTTAGKRKTDDTSDITVSDLAYPATTDAKTLAVKMHTEHQDRMTVVFSTYQSIQVISEAQKKHSIPSFDLIICDEAHRTTGATLTGEDESNFVKVHDQNFLKGKKRIYMTATPRIFGDVVKAKADEVDATLCSMDDTSLFGETLYTLTFSEAVQLGLLSDYKVLVLAVDEAHVSRSVQKLLTDPDSELKLDDATKIIGCWKALSKFGLKD